MVHRLFFLLLLMGVFALALWDIWRRNPQLRDQLRRPRPPAPRPPLRPVAPPVADEGSGKVLAFKRDPFRTLGLEATAGRDEVLAAHARLHAENAPEKLAGMSEELQELARRRCAQLDRARDEALERIQARG